MNTCMDCGVETSGYGKRCRRCAAIKLWESPEYRCIHAKAMKKAFTNPGYRNKLSAARMGNQNALGYKHSEEDRQRQSEATTAAWARGCHNNMFTEEWRVRNSEAVKAAWARGDFGGEEYQRKRSKSLAAAHRRGCYDTMFTENIRRKMSEARKTAHKRGVYDGVYRNPSNLELKVAESLDIQEIEYIQQFRPTGMSKPFDFYLPKLNILVEVQGDYWHNLPGAQKRDVDKAVEATALGYDVREIWEHTIQELGVLNTLELILEEKV